MSSPLVRETTPTPNLGGNANIVQNPSSDPNVGSSRGDASTTSGKVASGLTGGGSSSSGSALMMTLIPALIYAVFWFGLFLIFRRTQRRWYAPRSHLPDLHEHERSPELPSGWVNWFGIFFKIEDNHVLHHSSLDGYLFLRFLRVLCAICFFGCLITWPILLPIHATGGNKNTQLDILSFSNVKSPNKYYANVLVAWVFFSEYSTLSFHRDALNRSQRSCSISSPARASTTHTCARPTSTLPPMRHGSRQEPSCSCRCRTTTKARKGCDMFLVTPFVESGSHRTARCWPTK